MATLRTARKPRVEFPDQAQVVLGDVESQICTLLDECTQYIKANKGLATSCRVAGGWVRDKLLGLGSNDIDIAVADMMGRTYAEHLVDFMETQKHIPVTKIAIMEQNPGQSKHLETAHTTVLGLEVDFVNLRGERYAENSRIPIEVTFGTPLEDALRRDITINALFYDVHTQSVQDYTEKGVPDLRGGIIRTPLPPRETFQDDPLRILRCIRFASRFGFDLVPELQDAARDPAIQDVLIAKVSRDRVGTEVHKMMTGRDPLYAIQLIRDLQLQSSIFFIPRATTSTFSAPLAPFSTSLSAATILYTLLFPTPTSLLPRLHPLLTSPSPVDTARLFLASALTNYHDITYTDNKKKVHPAVEAVIREGLKLGTQNHYLDGIPPLFAAAEMLRDPKLERMKEPSERVAIGLLLRDKSVHNLNTGSQWMISVLFAVIQELVPCYDSATDNLAVEEATAIIETYNNFIARVVELDLPAAVDARPILDGREVVSALGAHKSGAWTGQVLARVVEWQLEHPMGTKDECTTWLKVEHAEGKVSIDDKGASIGKRVKRMDGAVSKRAKHNSE